MTPQSENFDWLAEEIRNIRSKKFFQFEPCAAEEINAFESGFHKLPDDYKSFIRTFGRARLFRHRTNPWHCLEVFAPPKIDEGKKATWIELGSFLNTGDACLQFQNGVFAENGAIYVGEFEPRRKYTNSFHEWLKKSFALARALFTNQQWEELTAPAPPFGPREQEILNAVSLFTFRKIGVAGDGDVLVEVHNGSTLELPMITVGVQLGRYLRGQCGLRTAGIGPGETKIVQQPIYKGARDATEVELFRLPLPEPDDRRYYLEFRNTSLQGRWLMTQRAPTRPSFPNSGEFGKEG